MQKESSVFGTNMSIRIRSYLDWTETDIHLFGPTMSADKVEELGRKAITFDLMAAMSSNRGIANKLCLPWPPIKKDLEYYVERIQRKSSNGMYMYLHELVHPTRFNALKHRQVQYYAGKHLELNGYDLNLINTIDDYQGKKCVNIRGRVTWECTPEVEKNNVYSIVISKSMRDSGLPQDPQIHKVCASVKEAIDYCSSPPFCDEIGPIWIMGGVKVYQEAINLPQCRYIFLTYVYKTFEADTFFPRFEDQFEEVSLDDVDGSMQEENGLKFQFKVYKKSSEA